MNQAAESMYRSLQDGEHRQLQLQQSQDQQRTAQQMQLERQQLADENRRLQQQLQAWQSQQGAGGKSAPAGAAADSAEKGADTTRGCPYLIHTQHGLTHPPGTTYCHRGQTLMCKLTGKDDAGRLTYGWHTVSASSCAAGYPTPEAKESYGARLSGAAAQMYEEF